MVALSGESAGCDTRETISAQKKKNGQRQKGVES